MLDLHLPQNKQITISDAVLRKANISPEDKLDIRCQEGVIMLVCSEKLPSNAELLDFAGSTQGLYGNNTAERLAYINNERISWEK